MTSVTATTSTGSKNKRKAIGVVLLSGEELIIHVDVKGKLYEVFNQVAAHLSLRETEYFGLAILRDEEYQFLILDEKISKVAPKKWKTGPGEGLDSEGKPLFSVWFRVQFYVDQVVLLREKVTRHLYYLQLKENVLKYNHLYNEEKCFQIVGFALQADYGNYIADKHIAGYFDPRQYFPAWILEKRGAEYLGHNCPLVHRDLHNVTRTDAELKYVRECSSPPGAHNLHFYRARKKKTDKVCNTWLAICARGVEVYEDDAGYKNLISTFLWPDIGRLVFDKKKFEIRSVGSAGGRRFAYYTESDVTSKYLLHICRSTHMFQMAIQPKLMEIRHLDAEDKKRYRESYIYSDVRDLHKNGGPVQFRSNKSPGKSPAGNQRYSVISDASSNTTSGIVSDKMAISFDEGEEPGHQEIIIDCPPRQSSLHGVPGQPHTKMPLRGSYKMTPPTPGSRSPALPPQSLELFRSPGSSGKGSPATPHLQELSPASSTGSYRAKLQQTTHSLYTKPYVFPTPSPSSPGQPYSLRNPSPSSPREREFPSVARSASQKESFKGLHGPMLAGLERNVSGDSTATTGSTASTGIVALSVENSPVTQSEHGGVQYASSPVTQQGHVLGVSAGQYHPSSPKVTGTPSFYSPASFSQALPGQVMGTGGVGGMVYQVESPSGQQTIMGYLGVPSPSPPQHHLTTPHPPPMYTDRSKEVKTEEVQEVLAPPPAFADASSRVGEAGGSCVKQVEHSHGCPSHSSHSSGAVSSNSSYTQGGSIDSGHVLSDIDSSSAHHSAQSSEEDSGVNYSDSSTSRKTGVKRNTPAKVKAGSKKGGNKATHVSVKNQKEALHPDIEQILGQTQAASLPFITALCNDLMTGSTHSSTGSYDTATLRSSDSSHPDSRRWSTCGPMETSMGAESGCSSTNTMLVAVGGGGARPYSWHSEHFDLDATLSAMPQQRGNIVPRFKPHAHFRPPHPNHPLPLQDNHRSFPHDLYTASSAGNSVLWTQAVTNNSGSSAPYGGSLDRYSPELLAQQLIPSRLNSGGHSVTDSGNIGPHKMLKENIGIA
ncbi:uncharacterized protein [Littorina saxatilis]|uniref:FERM domain-containing protein n=1 Tax=Littorina saxatilis TaxID=31220 RepID=A0AAN9BGK1_9CAEN